MAAPIQDAIMLFGDSITQGAWDEGGFGSRLTHTYARKLDVLNRGLSGYNTEWALPVFEQSFATNNGSTPKVQLLTIWFGANDACIKPSPQHVPLPKFADNLRQMVDMVQSKASPRYSASTRIILITPPPINEHQRKEDLESRDPPLELDRVFDITKQYAEAVKEVGAEKQVAVLDVWTSLWEAAGKDQASLSKYLSDGLHLTAEGYKVVYSGLIDIISERYPEIHHEKLQYVFAPWSEVDFQNPLPTLQLRTAGI